MASAKPRATRVSMASRAALGVSVGCLLMLFLRGDLGQCAVPRSAFRLCATGGFALAPLSASAAQLQALLQKRSGKDLTSPIFNIPPKQQVYPSWLEGHWSVLSRFVGFEFPTLPRQQVMRQEDVPGFKTCSIIDFADVGKSPLEYNLTYVRDDNVGGVVEDWPQNLRSTVAAHLSPGKGRVTSVDYTPSQDPNRLTMRLGCGLSYRKIAEDFLKLKRDVKKAATNGKRAVSLFQEIQDPQEEANGWHMLAEIYAAEGDLAEASQCVSNARTLCRSLKDHLAETKAMECLVTALLEHDQFQEGIKVAKEIVSVHHDAGDREREGFALISLAQHLLRFYDFANAEKVASAADFIFKSIHDKEGVRVSQQLKDAAEHGIKAEHVQQAVAQRQEFLNLPQPLIIDPGRNTRMQEAFTAFAKAA